MISSYFISADVHSESIGEKDDGGVEEEWRGASVARSSAVPNLGGVYARPEILEIAVYFPAEGIELATLRVTPRPHPVVFLDGKAKPAARPPPPPSPSTPLHSPPSHILA